MQIGGLYGIYEVTREFAKVYPNWFERKFMLFSFYVTMFINFFLNFSPDYMIYKLYPLTPISYYGYLVLHYFLKSFAMILIFFVANLD